jgi:N-formylglutamate amidohydrolase
VGAKIMDNSNNDRWHFETGDSPLLAIAIHDGNEVRKEVADRLALSASDRLREEDPFTGSWTTVAPTRLVVRPSRFEVDLNRPREKAVYKKPEDAWGLQVWRRPPPRPVIDRSLAIYDEFYSDVDKLLSGHIDRFGHVVVFDLHSYNHRRDGPEGEPDEAAGNPEVNIGTGTMDRQRWAPVVDRFIDDLRAFEFLGRNLDVRENAKFRGGNFPRWTHETFPGAVCTLAIEFKKFFMDEWTGQLYPEPADAIVEGLRATVPGMLEELNRLG